jgi:hypothetical protein
LQLCFMNGKLSIIK